MMTPGSNKSQPVALKSVSLRHESKEPTMSIKTDEKKMADGSRIIETAKLMSGTGLESLNASFTSSEDDDELYDKEKASQFTTSTQYREHLAEKRLARRQARK